MSEAPLNERARQQKEYSVECPCGEMHTISNSDDTLRCECGFIAAVTITPLQWEMD